MINIPVLGVNKNSIPLSDAFSVDIINDSIYVSKNIYSISKISLSITSEYVDTFSVLSKYYVNILVYINIKIDYLCISHSVNYHIFKINKIIPICTGDFKCSKNIPIDCKIIDVNITNFTDNNISIYLLLLLSAKI